MDFFCKLNVFYGIFHFINKNTTKKLAKKQNTYMQMLKIRFRIPMHNPTIGYGTTMIKKIIFFRSVKRSKSHLTPKPHKYNQVVSTMTRVETLANPNRH